MGNFQSKLDDDIRASILIDRILFAEDRYDLWKFAQSSTYLRYHYE